MNDVAYNLVPRASFPLTSGRKTRALGATISGMRHSMPWMQSETAHILVPRGRAPFLSAPKITTSGQVQHRKSAIHGLPVTLRMLRVKSDKCDWFWSQSIVFTKPFKTGMSLDLARGRDFWC